MALFSKHFGVSNLDLPECPRWETDTTFLAGQPMQHSTYPNIKMYVEFTLTVSGQSIPVLGVSANACGIALRCAII